MHGRGVMRHGGVRSSTTPHPEVHYFHITALSGVLFTAITVFLIY